MAVQTKAERAISLYTEGRTLRQIQTGLKMSHEGVRRLLLSEGILLRDTGNFPGLRYKRSFGKLTTRERFLSLIDKDENDHWIWKKNLYSGYGKFRMLGFTYYAHVAAFILIKKKRPKGNIRNKCGLKSCVNPDHWKEKVPQSTSRINAI